MPPLHRRAISIAERVLGTEDPRALEMRGSLTPILRLDIGKRIIAWPWGESRCHCDSVSCMHIQTHIMSGWCAASLFPLTARQRLACMIAASAADLDGL